MAAFTEQQKTEFSMQKWYDLSGKTAVVTGGITGLGLAITRCLVSAGAKVIALSRTDEKKGNEILKEFGGKAVFYQFDITDTDHAQVIADRIQKEQGPVDILVNNAGNHCKKYIWDMSVEDYKNVLDVHLVGAFALTKAFIPQMKERGWGRIIFQASMTSYIGQPQVCGYSTAKAGYLGLIHTLTAEVAEYGITVNAIAPGFINTEMTEVLTDAVKEGARGQIPLGHFGRPEDVAKAAAFLASEDAAYITGQVIHVDGGMVM